MTWEDAERQADRIRQATGSAVGIRPFLNTEEYFLLVAALAGEYYAMESDDRIERYIREHTA